MKEPGDRDSVPIPTCDAHHHFIDAVTHYYPRLRNQPWGSFRYGSYEHYPKTYSPDDFRRDTARQNIVASVHMECEWDPADPVGETRFVSGLAEECGLPTALVARAFLDREDVAEVLGGHAAYPLTRGIRHKPKATATAEEAVRNAPGSMDDKTWRDGYARLAAYGWSFDLQAPYWHFDQARDLAMDFPDIPMILDHCGLPADRTEDGLAAWRRAMAVLAEAPNVSVKVSGIAIPGEDWTADANRGVVLDTISAFGVGRCMVASNWPADSLAASSYDAVMNGFREICAVYSASEQAALFHDNAVRIYRLQPQTRPQP